MNDWPLGDKVVFIMSLKYAQRKSPHKISAQLGEKMDLIADTLEKLKAEGFTRRHPSGEWTLTSAGNMRRNSLTRFPLS